MPRTPLRGFRHTCLVLLSVAAALPRADAQLVPTNWSGNGNWDSNANWSQGVAQNSHLATLSTGTATVADTRSVGALVMTGGTLAATGSLTVVATGSSWQSGSLSGSGRLTIASGSDLAINGPDVKTLDGQALSNQGAITWSGGTMSTGNGATITNQAGATFTTSFDGTLAYYIGGNRTVFTNNGTFTKSAGTGVTDLQSTFNNSGAVNVNTGSLQLSGGGSSSGSITLASTSNLRLTGDYEFASGSSVNGPGSVQIVSGTTTFTGTNSASAHFSVTGGTATFSGNTVSSGGGTFSGGTLNGTGSVAFANAITLAGTTLGGSGTLSANGGATVAGSFSFNGGRTLQLAGNSTWSNGSIYGGDSSVLINQSGGNFTTSVDGALHGTYYGGGAATTVFNNQGTFTKSAGAANGATEITAVFNNAGTVQVQAGNLKLGGGGTQSGTVNVSSGASLLLNGGTHTFASGAAFTGAGTLNIAAGTTTFSGTTNGTAHLAVTGGTATFSGNTVTTGGGTFSGGTLNGTGTLELGGTAILSGTTLFGAGVINANGGAAITGSFSLSERTVNLGGNSTWSNGSIYAGGGATLTNQAGATFTTTTSSTLNGTYYGGGTATTVFNNQGTFAKTTDTGSTDITAILQNTGTISVQSGTLTLRNGGTNTGVLNIADGATFAVDGATFALDSGTRITGPGALRLTSGTTTVSGEVTSAGAALFSGGNFNGAGSLTLGGLLTLQGTTLNGTGTLAATAGAAITNSFSLHSGQTLTLGGNSTWTNGTIYHGGGGTLNQTGNLTATANGSLYHYYGGTPLTFNNSGTFTKMTGAGTTELSAVLHNTGTIDVQSGTVTARAGGSNAGTINVASGATFEVNGGTFAFNAASQLHGAGTVLVSNGEATFAGAGTATANIAIAGGNASLAGSTTTAGGGTLSGGTVTGSGNLVFGAPVTLSGTTLSGNGTVTAAGGAALVNNFTLKEGQTLTLAGNSTWSGGGIYHGGGGTLNNTGTLTQSAAGFLYHYYGGAKLTFNNSGTFTQSIGTGTSDFNALFNNTGTVHLAAGTLNLYAGGSSSGPINISTGGTLIVSNGFTVADAANISGEGAFRLSGGTLALSGTLGVATFTMENGQLAGSPTFAHTVNWHGGDWNAASTGSTTTIATGGTLLLANGGNKDFDRRNITVAAGGAVEWQSGHLRAGNGSIFTNNGTFLDRNAYSYSIYNPSFGGTFSFVNAGTYTRDVGGTTTFEVPFENRGTVNLTAGNLQLEGGGTMSATSIVQAAAGTHVYFNRNYNLLDGAQLLGAGTFIQTGGTLAIDGALRATSFNWSGGDWNATAAALTTVADGTVLNLASGGNKDFNRRSITVDAGGVVNWDAGYLRGGNGSTFTNRGTFHDRNAYSYSIVDANSSGFGGAFTFVNHGVYLRDVGGTTYFSAPFENHGTITLSAGALRFEGGGTMSATSVVTAAAGTSVYFANSYTLAHGAKFTGAGTFAQTAGTLAIDGALQASSFNWSGGNWNATAAGLTTTIAAGTTLTVGSGGNKDFNQRGVTVASGGVFNWESGHLRSGNGGSLVNDGTFNDQNAYSYSMLNPGTGSGFGGNFTFTNRAVYNKTTPGTTYVEIPFANTGTLNIAGGTMAFSDTFSNSGVVRLSHGAQASFAAPISFAGDLTGTGTIHAASVTAGGLVSPGNSPGTLTLTGNLTLLATSTLLIELGGTYQGTEYDFLSVGGTAVLAGNLSVGFIQGFQSSVQPAQAFTVLTAGTSTSALSGAFANVASGQRLFTSDGAGSFLVNYGAASAFPTLANSVVLSDFQAIPEPSTYALLGLGAVVVFRSIRRRPRR